MSTHVLLNEEVRRSMISFWRPSCLHCCKNKVCYFIYNFSWGWKYHSWGIIPHIYNFHCIFIHWNINEWKYPVCVNLPLPRIFAVKKKKKKNPELYEKYKQWFKWNKIFIQWYDNFYVWEMCHFNKLVFRPVGEDTLEIPHSHTQFEYKTEFKKKKKNCSRAFLIIKKKKNRKKKGRCYLR